MSDPTEPMVGTTSRLLGLIRSGSAPTRTALQAQTGLSRSTVLQRVALLVSSGLVREHLVDGGTGRAGRPPSTLSFNESLGVVLAADLGTSHGRVAVADLGGRTLAEHSERLDVRADQTATTEWLVTQLKALLGATATEPSSVLAVGVGVPGRVDLDQERPVAIVPGWSGTPLAETLGEVFRAPVLLDNDVKTMALGEYRSLRQRLDPLLFLKLAGGIGAGLVVNGTLYRGVHGAAGQIGHLRASTTASDVRCSCGNHGCLTALVSGTAVARQLSEAGVPAASTADVVRLVSSGSYEAFEHVRQAGRTLAEALSVSISMLAPRAIVIGGELAQAREPLLAGLREVVYQRSLPIATGDLQILPSELGPRAGVVGAVMLALDHALSPEGLRRLVASRGSVA